MKELGGAHENALNRFAAAFAGADADAIVERQDEDFAVADLARRAGAAALDDRVDRRLDEVLVHRDHELHLAQQIDRELAPLIEHLGLALLPAEALAIHDREPHDLDFGQGLLDVLQLARLDDGDDQFHGAGGLGDEISARAQIRDDSSARLNTGAIVNQ